MSVVKGTHAEIDELRSKISAKYSEVEKLLGYRFTEKDKLHLKFANLHLTYAQDLLAQNDRGLALKNIEAAHNLVTPIFCR